MEDTYCVILENDFYHFYKNNELHRELGPAFFHEQYKEQYLNLGDESQYKLIVDKEKTTIITNLVLQYMGQTAYYVDGNYYEEKYFKKVVLNNQLNKELLNKNNHKKKMKV